MSYQKYEVLVYSNRTEWRNEQGQLHRTNGPAIEYADGYKAWYINGKRHRIDGPAIEYHTGIKAWYINSLRHRIDGPAVEGLNGYKEWWINDEKLSEEQFKRQTEPKPSCEGRTVEIDGQKYKLVLA